MYTDLQYYSTTVLHFYPRPQKLSKINKKKRTMKMKASKHPTRDTPMNELRNYVNIRVVYNFTKA